VTSSGSFHNSHLRVERLFGIDSILLDFLMTMEVLLQLVGQLKSV